MREDCSTSERGELCNLFREWVTTKYPPAGVLTDTDWEEVMADDSTKSVQLAGWVSQVGSGVQTSSPPRPIRNVRKVWASDLHFSYSSVISFSVISE